MGLLQPLVSSNVIVHVLVKILKSLMLGSFSIFLPPSGLRGFVPVVRDAGEGPGVRGAIPLGGVGAPGLESINT